MVACSAMALLKEEESNEEDKSPEGSWAKWKHGGIVGAAALTGGTLMAITGGVYFFPPSIHCFLFVVLMENKFVPILNFGF